MSIFRRILQILIVFILFSLSPVKVFAVCPVCTVAVGAGIGLSRWLGIDDVITGIWVGGFTISVSLWTINWLLNRNINFKILRVIVFLVYYLLIVIPLFFTGIMGHPINKIWGVDKLLVGIIFGSIGFIIGNLWYNQLKEYNDGHAYFPFQKVVMPISVLFLLSIVFFFLTK